MSIVFVSGCAKPMGMNTEHGVVVNLSRADITVGDKITVSDAYSAEDISSGYAKSTLTEKALKDTGYDFIMLECFTVKPSIVGNPTVILTGYLAKLK